MKTIVAYHNDAKVKKKYLDRVRAHRAADELVQGISWENGKGCAIGCTLDAYDHSRYPVELGIPEMLARLEDNIFEGLTNGKAKEWPERFLEAITPGTDLSLVGQRFLLAITKRRRKKLDANGVRLVGNAIDQVIKVLADWAEYGKVDKSAAWSAARNAESAARSAERSAARNAESAARSAENAAWSAAWSAESAAWSAENAAWSAAWSAENAVWSAAWSAENAVWSAAWSAARSAAWSAENAVWSAAWSAARSAEYEWMADTLVDLLKAAK